MTLVAQVIPTLRCQCGNTLMEHAAYVGGDFAGALRWLECQNHVCRHVGKRFAFPHQSFLLNELPKDATA